MNLNADVNEGLMDTNEFNIEMNDIKNSPVINTLISKDRIKEFSLESFKVSSIKRQDKLDIKDKLSKDQVICKNDAISIETIFGGFINECVKLNEFTEVKSKVSYDKAMSFINKRIAKEDLDSIEILAKLIEEETNTLNTNKEKIEADNLNQISDNISTMIATNSAIVNNIMSNTDTVFTMTNSENEVDFINVATNDLGVVADSKVQWKYSSDIKDKLNELNSLTHSEEFVMFHYVVTKGIYINEFFNNESHYTKARVDFEGMTLQSLVKFLKVSGITNVLSTFTDFFNSNIVAIELTKSKSNLLYSELEELNGKINPVILVLNTVATITDVTEVLNKVLKQLDKEIN